MINFEPKHIKCNQEAKNEMERMRKESQFIWDHPLSKVSGNVICLYNIRSWRAHLEQFLSNKVYTTHCDLLCFTETHLQNQSYDSINKLNEKWDEIHKDINHGLAICFNIDKVKVVRECQLRSNLEVLAVVLNIKNEIVLLVLVYRKPGPVGCFVEDILDVLLQLPTEYRTLIILNDVKDFFIKNENMFFKILQL